jgi:hypothetical protein
VARSGIQRSRHVRGLDGNEAGGSRVGRESGEELTSASAGVCRFVRAIEEKLSAKRARPVSNIIEDQAGNRFKAPEAEHRGPYSLKNARKNEPAAAP